MAVGRISGPLLKANLIRNGIDLSFETDLLYLDVNNQRIGVKSTTPQYELDVNGTTRTTDLIVTNNADIADININGNTISTPNQYLNLATLDTVVALNKIRIDSVDIEGNAITTNSSNANLEFRPNGTGSVDVHSDMNVDGNIYATGNITADGNITIGDQDTDNVIFNAEIASDLIPDQDRAFDLGSNPATGGKEWRDIYVNRIFASSLDTTDAVVGGVDLTLRHNNVYYVAENGDDTHYGNHILDPFATIKHALSVAVAGDTIHVYPGDYTEVFPLTVPQGVTLKGEGIRSVTIRPTTETRYNDAILLNGETTVEDLTITGFYSGGNYFEVTGSAAGSTTVNVGTAPFAHTYVSGGTINIGGADYAVTGATYTHTTGVLVVTHAGPAATLGNDVFLSNLTFSCNNDTRTFPDNGYGFRYATDYEATSRSPYIRNITVITQGSTTSVSDPRGFDAGDAGKGAYIDGAYGTSSSVNTALLFHSATFITPGVDAITMTNGARVEWLNSFTYFANRSMYAYDSKDGRRLAGRTKLTLSGVTGTFTQGNTLTVTSTDASTVLTGTIDEVDGNDLYISNYLELDGFDLTPQSITDGTATATTIDSFDLREFGAEVRLIASASVYGNYGLVGQGPGVIMYAIGHNLAYIGNGKEVTNDPNTVIQANEIVESEGARIRYNSVDHKGDFRVGDLFYVNQETGNVTFAVSDFEINTENGVTFTTGADTTFVDGTKIETGDWRISGNTVETLTQDANFAAGSGEVNLNGNVNVTGSLDVTGNVTIGGNITIGDEATDTIQIVAGIDSDIIPKVASTYTLGTATKTWKNLFVNEINVDDIQIRENYIETTLSNSDLELRANGTGEILVPSNNVQIDNDLTVSGTSNLSDTNITGTLTLTGDLTQTGDTTVDGNVTVTQDLDVTGAAQFEEILVDDNYITTTSSNADLELRANGTGEILVPNNNVHIVNNLIVDNNISANNVTVADTTTSDIFTTGNIVINDNYIETSQSNSDLDLRANGTGRVYVPSNDVEIEQDFTIDGTSNLSNTVIQGSVTQVGDTTQTGNIDLTGNLGITGNVTVSGAAQFEDIRVETNFITSTLSNSDLELRATQYGDILIPSNDLHITNDLIVDGTITVGNVNSAGTITANRFSTGDILIDDNFVTTTLSNSNLELRANGTGEIYIPSNDVVIDNNLTVNGSTSLKDTTIVGNITHTGNVTQTGDINLTGNLDVTGEVIISASLIQFEDIQISGNRITTTESNSNLDLRANGTGVIYIPDNNVVIENNLDVNGTITVGNITSTGTITANSFSTGDILIDDNFITTTLSNSDLELRANGTGSIIIDTFSINDTTITSSGDFNITPGSNLVNINATGALTLPTGTTLERPTVATGQIRYNTDLTRFEGYNGTNWINLKGVEDLDGDTKVTAEITEGANDGVIRFYTQGSVVATIDSTRLTVPLVDVDDIRIDGNVIETITPNTDLELSANGTGTVNFDNFAFKDSTITNTVTNSITTFESTGNGYVKFGGSYGIVLPIGTSGERPPIGYTETGQMRFNTQDSRVEIWDGQNWVSVAGSGSGITRGDAEEIALATVLVLG
jgi:cytoskeletal protein CcmA (bactofilin family)